MTIQSGGKIDLFVCRPLKFNGMKPYEICQSTRSYLHVDIMDIIQKEAHKKPPRSDLLCRLANKGCAMMANMSHSSEPEPALIINNENIY